jgi:hypothetical protein
VVSKLISIKWVILLWRGPRRGPCLCWFVWLRARPVSYEILENSDSLMKLTIAEWKLVEERLQKWCSSWKGKLLSLEGRLVLINSVLSNMVMHMISFFLFPKGVLHKLDYYRSRVFWQVDSEKKKYRLANGVCFVVLKIRVGSVFMTYRSKIRSYWVSGCLIYLLRRGPGKLF